MKDDILMVLQKNKKSNTSPNMKEILAIYDLNLPQNSRGTDKGSQKSYVDMFYECEFKRFRDQPIRILEIGFRHGASLALWSHYFSKAEIFGLDNGSDHSVTYTSPTCMEWLNLPNITTIYGDAYDLNFVDALTGSFDIMIDDGPHSLLSQLKFI